MSADRDRIEWNADMGRWLLSIDGQPVAAASRLDIMTRHFPDAEVIQPTSPAA